MAPPGIVGECDGTQPHPPLPLAGGVLESGPAMAKPAVARSVFPAFLQAAVKRDRCLIATILAACAAGLALSAVLALPWGDLVTASCRWDCFWYTDIAARGYSSLPLIYDSFRPAQASWAFFPLYPAAIHIAARILAIGVLPAGLLVNIVLWPVLIFFCYRDMELRNMREDRVLFAVFCVLYPFNVWYTAQYSECIYGVTLMAAIVALRSGRIGLSAVACALMALSRPTGIVMAVCLAVWRALPHQISGFPAERETLSARLSDSLLLIAAGGAGLSLFVLYLFDLTGDGFAFSHVQIAWHRSFGFFLFHILAAFGGVKDGVFAAFTLLSFVLIWKMRASGWNLNALLVGATVLLASSTGVHSMERYVFSNPLTIQFLAHSVLSLPLPQRRNMLASMGLLHIATSLLWYHGSRLVL